MKDFYHNLKTHLDFFYHWEEKPPDRIFLRQPFGDTWTTITFGEAGEAARRVANGLQKLGLEPGDHISIISKNCYHWVLADLAIMMGGFVSTPFYPNLSSAQLAEVLDKSDTKAIFCRKTRYLGEY